MSGAYTRSGIILGSHTPEQVARHEAAIQKIRELLTERPLTNMELALRPNIPAHTVYRYLCHLQDMGEAYQMGGVDARPHDLGDGR
jgi:hypothetical protein